jgi:hypothetical protein
MVAAVPAFRTPVLRAAGRALVAEDALGPADMILVTTASDGAGVLEAADLVRAGVATRVAVFSSPMDAADRELVRRGLPFEDDAARSVRYLRALGVTSVEAIPDAVAGTEDESRALPPWCDRKGLGSLVVVTTPDHSRRLRRVLHRFMRGHSTRVAVRVARYSQFDAEAWWQTRDGARIAIVEMQKLLADVLLHPLP